MYSWRVTKYDPLNRDADGRYLNDEEWTCFSEVGTKVSIEEYLKTEQNYKNAIRSFMDEMGLATNRKMFIVCVNAMDHMPPVCK